MKRKTLFVVLLIPFIVAILGFVNVIIIRNYVEVDIAGIDWNYNETNGFKIQDEPYKLEATPVFDEELILSEGNDLKWSMSKKDEEKNICSITSSPNATGKKDYFLNTFDEGEVTLTCSNEKGNKSRSLKAVIYKDGTIIINPVLVGNGESISQKRAFGEYDISYSDLNSEVSKTKTNIELDIKVLPEGSASDIVLTDKSDNVILTSDNKSMSFNGNGDGFINFELKGNPFVKGSYNFQVIENGVNVYDYNDLLKCTNKSENGEIVCLQTNLESLDNTYQKEKNGKYSNKFIKENTKLFGNFDFKTQKTSFKDEVYRFDTTYNDEYINQYFSGEEIGTKNDILSGIHVQKDFYGNGFVINGRELTYPNNGFLDQYNGRLTPNPSKGDLFLGPLTFVSIGLYEAPVMKAFGQDNSLMYVDGSNIKLNDLNIQNTNKFEGPDGQNDIYNLEFTGTCIDVHGQNIVLENSRLQNARNLLRVYSSDGFTLKNSVLERAREFLMKIGNNETLKMMPNDLNFKYHSKEYNGSFKDFMYRRTPKDSEILAQEFLEDEIFGEIDTKEKVDELLQATSVLQNSLDKVKNDMSEIDYAQNITIEDSYFYRSGIFAIAFDTYFNGPFLYNGAPFKVKDYFKLLGINVLNPENISGVMEPTQLTIKGDTKFYDWKTDASIDASCLIEERLGQLLGDMFGDGKPNIDDYFPMKLALKKLASENNYVYSPDSEKTYINTPIAWYGGGLNLSSVNYEEVETKDFGNELLVDITKVVYSEPSFNPKNSVAKLLSKCIPIAAGYHPFRFITNDKFEGKPYLFGEVPQIEDLKERAIKE